MLTEKRRARVNGDRGEGMETRMMGDDNRATSPFVAYYGSQIFCFRTLQLFSVNYQKPNLSYV